VNAAQRATLALKLRAEKMSYDQIAHRCGYADRGTAHKAVQRELQRVVVANVEELRQEEVNTLDVMQSECMRLFLDRENKGRLFAADRLLAIMERRARLLGLDLKPEQAIAAAQVIIRETPAGYFGGGES
jgi:hypothetical protein